MEKVIEAAERIRRLEVQGATNVAFAAVEALVEQMRHSKARDHTSALKEIAGAKEILFKSRETEPFMRKRSPLHRVEGLPIRLGWAR